MKVLMINAKMAIIYILIIVAIIVSGIVMMFGGETEAEKFPEVEIVLP